jgi:hypothetical protein
MKIGEYELSESTVFMLSESELPITVGAGGNIPFHAAWEKGEPREIKLDPDDFYVMIDYEVFAELAI